MGLSIDYKRILQDYSSLVLIFSNIIPLVGVLFFSQDLKTIIILYWAETGIIGLFNILKILFVDSEQKISLKIKILFIAFFSIHFGMFMIVHFVFLLAFLFSRYLSDTLSLIQAMPFSYYMLVGFFFSHGTSFVYNYFILGERKKVELQQLMIHPYSRVIIMHLTILFGGIVSIIFGQPVLLLILLIFGKTIADLIFHLKERERVTSGP